MRPPLGFAMFALVGACTNDFANLTIGNDAGVETVGASATSTSGGSGATASSAAGGDVTGGTGGLGANLADAGTTGGTAGAASSGGMSGSGGTPAAAPPCQDQYGPSVTLMCDQTEAQCAFNFANGSQSCAAVCTAGGGECVEMFSDYADNCGFDPQAPQGCEYVGFGDAVCICSRGCGGGAPCVAPALCTAGSCL